MTFITQYVCSAGCGATGSWPAASYDPNAVLLCCGEFMEAVPVSDTGEELDGCYT